MSEQQNLYEQQDVQEFQPEKKKTNICCCCWDCFKSQVKLACSFCECITACM